MYRRRPRHRAGDRAAGVLTALDRLENAAVEKQDKVARDADPILKRIEASPTEPTLYLQLAGVYRRHNQDDRARAALQQGLGPTGNHFTLQIELMECLQRDDQVADVYRIECAAEDPYPAAGQSAQSNS